MHQFENRRGRPVYPQVLGALQDVLMVAKRLQCIFTPQHKQDLSTQALNIECISCRVYQRPCPKRIIATCKPGHVTAWDLQIHCSTRFSAKSIFLLICMKLFSKLPKEECSVHQCCCSAAANEPELHNTCAAISSNVQSMFQAKDSSEL